jgi:hypothetical protein
MATTQIDGNTFTMKLIAFCARSISLTGRFGTQTMLLLRAATQSAGLNGTFTKTTGTVGDVGTAQLAGSLLLANNNFYRQFTVDPVMGTARAQQPVHLDAVIQSRIAIKTVAPCADSTGAKGRFFRESQAHSQSSAQTPCSPCLRQYGLRCARTGFSRRTVRHQYRCGVGLTQKADHLATSPKPRAWCE